MKARPWLAPLALLDPVDPSTEGWLWPGCVSFCNVESSADKGEARPRALDQPGHHAWRSTSKPVPLEKLSQQARIAIGLTVEPPPY
jgi:hypothetical protein